MLEVVEVGLFVEHGAAGLRHGAVEAFGAEIDLAVGGVAVFYISSTLHSRMRPGFRPAIPGKLSVVKMFMNRSNREAENRERLNLYLTGF